MPLGADTRIEVENLYLDAKTRITKRITSLEPIYYLCRKSLASERESCIRRTIEISKNVVSDEQWKSVSSNMRFDCSNRMGLGVGFGLAEHAFLRVELHLKAA